MLFGRRAGRRTGSLRPVIDLHTHSTVSDGSEAPGRVVELAAAAGCSAMALTDHDSLAGLDEAGRWRPELGVRLVPGCEVSCRKPAPPPGAPRIDGSVHVLVYFVEPGYRAPPGRARQRCAATGRCATESWPPVSPSSGTGVTYEDVLAEAGDEGGMGRPHFARALVKAGAAEDIDDAFDRYLADGRPGYVPKARLDAARRGPPGARVGGRGRAGPPAVDRAGARSTSSAWSRELAEDGLDGIEAVYSSYTPDQRAVLRRMAERTGLRRHRAVPTSTARSSPASTWAPDAATCASLTTCSTNSTPAWRAGPGGADGQTGPGRQPPDTKASKFS